MMCGFVKDTRLVLVALLSLGHLCTTAHGVYWGWQPAHATFYGGSDAYGTQGPKPDMKVEPEKVVKVKVKFGAAVEANAEETGNAIEAIAEDEEEEPVDSSKLSNALDDAYWAAVDQKAREEAVAKMDRVETRKLRQKYRRIERRIEWQIRESQRRTDWKRENKDSQNECDEEYDSDRSPSP